MPIMSTIQNAAFAIYNDIEVSRLESCIKVLLLKYKIIINGKITDKP
jgi:hypothetical protein